MSVQTDADRRIEKAKELLSEAYTELLSFLHSDTWGTSEYKEQYIDDVHEVSLQILKLKRKL